jgi:hypothetical protein
MRDSEGYFGVSNGRICFRFAAYATCLRGSDSRAPTRGIFEMAKCATQFSGNIRALRAIEPIFPALRKRLVSADTIRDAMPLVRRGEME